MLALALGFRHAAQNVTLLQLAAFSMVRLCSLLVLLALTAGCDGPKADAHAEADEAQSYTPVAVEVAASEQALKLDGIATLINPDALAQLDADMRSAEIAANFSRRAFDRYKVTKSLPQHFVDNSERQARTDQTQLALLQLKLRNAWGDTAPFLDGQQREKLVAELSTGKTSLVRLDFPRSVERDPKNVRVVPLAGGEETSVTSVWQAPSGNLSMPGTSFFALMPTGPGLRPGDRAKVIAHSEASTSGVVIPASAIVVHAGQSWCYLETKAGEFERKAVSLGMPLADGYLVSDIAPGAKVVAHGASVLLSREADPSAGDDDDDDDGDEAPQRKAAPKDDDSKAEKDDRTAPGPQANSSVSETGAVTPSDPD